MSVAKHGQPTDVAAAVGVDSAVAAAGQRFAQDGSFLENRPSQAPDYVDLFERAPLGYVLLDAAGCIAKINHTGATMLGWEADWLAGKPFSRWVVNGDKRLFHVHHNQVRTCDQCLSEELRVKNRQGRTVHLRLQSVREPAHADGASGCRSLMIDVSSEERSARELRRLQSQLSYLARLNTAGELASGVAHELNQPLGTVVLNCEAALRLLNGGAHEEYELVEVLTQARDAACFASEVLRHLRGFLGSTGELATVCELPSLVQDVRKLIEADARDNDVELRLDIEPQLPPLYLDRVQIEQVLLNLAHNSIEAMREGYGPKRVTISARQEASNRILVGVADTGPGMNAQQMQRLFTPFFTTKSKGMGLGLPISRTIVEAHGGKLWADSEPGKGAAFHFTLPTIEDGRHAD